MWSTCFQCPYVHVIEFGKKREQTQKKREGEGTIYERRGYRESDCLYEREVKSTMRRCRNPCEFCEPLTDERQSVLAVRVSSQSRSVRFSLSSSSSQKGVHQHTRREETVKSRAYLGYSKQG